VRKTGALPPVTFAQKEAVLLKLSALLRGRRGAWARHGDSETTDYLLFAREPGTIWTGRSTVIGLESTTTAWLARDTDSVESMIVRWRQAGFRFVVVNHAGCQRSSIFPRRLPGLRPSHVAPWSCRADGGCSPDGRYSVFQNWD